MGWTVAGGCTRASGIDTIQTATCDKFETMNNAGDHWLDADMRGTACTAPVASSAMGPGTRAGVLGDRRRQRRPTGAGQVIAGALVGATLALAALPAWSQIAAPIGQPRGQPTPANGASGGRGDGSRDAGFAAPFSNWNQGGSRPFQSGFDQRLDGRVGSDSGVSLPQANDAAPPPARGPRAAPAAAIDRRADRRDEAPSVATRVVREGKVDSIERLQQLVQQGTMHETGLGAPRNVARAFDLYCEAAAQGYPEALVRMAWLYADGNGVEKSRAAAHTLFMRASRFGHGQAAELGQRFAGEPEVLPVCLRGTVVERGTVERPASREELAAFVPKSSASSPLRNAPALVGDRVRYAQMVLYEARRLRIDQRLVLAVMATESGFDPNARSPKNAFGLMQLIPETADRFNVRDINDPADNIRGGMAYLRWLLAYFRGDVALALAAYNAGEGAVDKHGGVPPYPETLAYVQRIRALYPFDRHPYDATVPARPPMVHVIGAAPAAAAVASEPGVASAATGITSTTGVTAPRSRAAVGPEAAAPTVISTPLAATTSPAVTPTGVGPIPASLDASGTDTARN